MPKYKVYITDYDYDDIDVEKSILEPIGAEVIGLQCKTGVGLGDLAKDADVIMARYAKITRETLGKLEKCKGICRYGIGVDTVDVQAVYDYGMILTNIPDFCIEEVAEHTIAMTLSLLRRIPIYDIKTKEGSWKWQDSLVPIKNYRSTTWGIIGFGKIAQNIVRKLIGFGFNIISYDPYVSETYMSSYGVTKVDINTLVKTSDVVNVMCPYTKETHHIIDEEKLRMMKKEAVVVNCSRGKLVDNNALYYALKNNYIASAALDDTEDEPSKNPSWKPSDNPLFSLDNCIITPHCAFYSESSMYNNRKLTAYNARAILLGERLINIVRP